MQKNIITHFENYNPTSGNTISNGYNVGQRWFNTLTGEEFLHKFDGVWVGSGAYTLSGHTHDITDINNLQTTLNSKSDTDHTHEYLPTSGGTITDNLKITGTLNVYGDIIQSGSTWETHTNQVYSSGDTITLRDGAINGLPPSGFTGIIAHHYDDDGNDGVLVFDRNGVARVGDMDIVNWTGSTQPIATREDSPIPNGFAYWDSGTTKFNTKIILPTDVSGLTDEYAILLGKLMNY